MCILYHTCYKLSTTSSGALLVLEDLPGDLAQSPAREQDQDDEFRPCKTDIGSSFGNVLYLHVSIYSSVNVYTCDHQHVY